MIVELLNFGGTLFLIILAILFFTFIPVGLWITAIFSGVRIGFGNLVGMRLRRVAPSKIVNPMIKATKAGIIVNSEDMEAHFLAGGNINTLVDALIAAERASIPLSFERGAAIDLAGRNVLEAVQVPLTISILASSLVGADSLLSLKIFLGAEEKCILVAAQIALLDMLIVQQTTI